MISVIISGISDDHYQFLVSGKATKLLYKRGDHMIFFVCLHSDLEDEKSCSTQLPMKPGGLNNHCCLIAIFGKDPIFSQDPGH